MDKVGLTSLDLLILGKGALALCWPAAMLTCLSVLKARTLSELLGGICFGWLLAIGWVLWRHGMVSAGFFVPLLGITIISGGIALFFRWLAWLTGEQHAVGR